MCTCLLVLAAAARLLYRSNNEFINLLASFKKKKCGSSNELIILSGSRFVNHRWLDNLEKSRKRKCASKCRGVSCSTSMTEGSI